MRRCSEPANTSPTGTTSWSIWISKNFFDRVNHDVLMSRLARRIGDTRLRRIIRRFLPAGMMRYGVSTVRHEGTPQGGPLSPMLSNLLLDGARAAHSALRRRAFSAPRLACARSPSATGRSAWGR